MVTLYVQSPTLYLAGSGIVIGATSATLTSLTDIYGNVLTMADFGDLGYITFEPDTQNAEAATFTGITANANGTYTLTGLKTILAKYPYTQTSGSVRSHDGGTRVVVTDNVGFWDTFINKNNDSTVVGKLTLPNGANRPVLAADTDTATATAVVTYGQLARTAIAGGTTASTTLLGYVKVSTNPVSALSPIAVGDNDTRVPTTNQTAALAGNNTDVAVGSGNKVVTQTGLQHGAEKYATISSGSTTAYVVTLSPAPTSYTNGMEVIAKIDVANTTTTPTVNVNGLGAKTVVKNVSTALNVGDLVANMFARFVYDGTNLVLQNPAIPDTGFLTSGSPGTTTTNTTATVLTYALAGGTLGTSKGVKIRLAMKIVTSAVASGGSYTVAYGGTTIGVFSASNAVPNSGTALCSMEILLMGSGATNTQHANVVGIMEVSGTMSSYAISSTQTTTAIDSTASQNVTVSSTSSSASVTCTFVDYFIQKIV